MILHDLRWRSLNTVSASDLRLRLLATDCSHTQDDVRFPCLFLKCLIIVQASVDQAYLGVLTGNVDPFLTVANKACNLVFRVIFDEMEESIAPNVPSGSCSSTVISQAFAASESTYMNILGAIVWK